MPVQSLLTATSSAHNFKTEGVHMGWDCQPNWIHCQQHRQHVSMKQDCACDNFEFVTFLQCSEERHWSCNTSCAIYDVRSHFNCKRSTSISPTTVEYPVEFGKSGFDWHVFALVAGKITFLQLIRNLQYLVIIIYRSIQVQLNFYWYNLRLSKILTV